MTKRRAASLCGLVLAAAFVMVLVRDCIDLSWRGPSPKPPPRLVTTRIAFPESLSVHEARLGPDGLSQFILATPPTRREWWKGPDGWGRRRDPKVPPPRARLYIRANQGGELHPIPGTEGSRDFSIGPDGLWIAFVAPDSNDAGRDYLWITTGDGRDPPLARLPWSATWGHMPLWTGGDALVVALGQGTEVLVIPRRQREAPRVVRIQSPSGAARVRSLQPCSLVPGRPIVLCDLSYMDGPIERAGFGALDLNSGRLTRLSEDGGSPHCLPDGRLVFARQGRLFLTRFAWARGALDRAPVPLRCVLQTPSPTGHASFDLAKDGTLSQDTAGDRTWADRGVVRRGSEQGYRGSSDFRAAFDRSPVASPNGNSFATEIANAEGAREIWVYRETQPYGRRLIGVPGDDVGAPAWSPNGSHMAYARFAQAPEGGVYLMAIDGSTPPRQIAANTPGRVLVPTSWSPDGTTILCTIREEGGSRVAALHTAGGPQEPRVLLGERISRDAHFSSDGRLVALEVGEPANAGVYVLPWNAMGRVTDLLRVSPAGGRSPRWGRDGSLYYISPDRKIMRSRIQDRGRVDAPTPSAVWDMEEVGAVDDLYDILPDARVLVVLRGTREGAKSVLTTIPRFVQQLPGLIAERGSAW